MSDLNDPRVLFAAERTLLAWSRTSLTLMAFGFLLERFGLFRKFLVPGHSPVDDHGASTWIGLGFVFLGSAFLVTSSRQYWLVLKSLRPIEIPERYPARTPLALNALLLLMSVILAIYILESL